jgi:hypothetical protein
MNIKTLACLASVLALTACADDGLSGSSTQQTWSACTGVESGPALNACLRDQMRWPQVAQRSGGEDAATFLLLGATALMNGYNQERQMEAARMPVSTSCSEVRGMINCLSY